jgi:hypothetical protein
MSQTELTIEQSIEASPNCATALLGLHCHECGQKKIHENEFALGGWVQAAAGGIESLLSDCFRLPGAGVAASLQTEVAHHDGESSCVVLL